MTHYSKKAYKLAVTLRSSKTILVEGPTDKKVLSRLFLSHSLATGSQGRYVIDEAELIKDEELYGYGHKAKVLAIAETLESMPEKFNWLVDREWDGINLNERPIKYEHAEPQGRGFRTKGHSIENYWFDQEIYENYLRQNYGGELPRNFFMDIRESFNSAIVLAAAFSLVAYRSSLITKCSDCIKADHIHHDGTAFSITGGFDDSLARRAAQEKISDQVNQEARRLGDEPSEIVRWISHGHLGEEMLRACIAYIAKRHTANMGIIEAIERGNKTAKLAHDSDQIAQLAPEKVEPLWDLVQWAT